MSYVLGMNGAVCFSEHLGTAHPRSPNGGSATGRGRGLGAGPTLPSMPALDREAVRRKDGLGVEHA